MKDVWIIQLRGRSPTASYLRRVSVTQALRPAQNRNDGELYYHEGIKEEHSLPTFLPLSLWKELNDMFKPYVGFVWGRMEQEGPGQISFLICTRKMVAVCFRRISKNAMIVKNNRIKKKNASASSNR